jgi:exo-1,4-beta-D-glucosaminidase
VARVVTLPAIDGLTSTYFLDLSLRDSDGKLVSSNFYWLSTKPDVLDWDKSTWYTTPTKSFDDLTALNTLPKVKVNVTSESEIDGENGTTRVTVENPTQNLAFAVHLKVIKPSRFIDPESENNELEVLPVIWQDNYFPLMPGEKREITATYKTADLQLESTSGDTPDWARRQGKPSVDVDGWNVVPVSTAQQ